MKEKYKKRKRNPENEKNFTHELIMIYKRINYCMTDPEQRSRSNIRGIPFFDLTRD